MSPRDPVLIDAETARFLLSGLSVSLAACSTQCRPSLSRACGLRLSQDHRELRIVVVAGQAERVLGDIARSGQVAVVCSEVLSHRTVQIKARDARVQSADEADRLAVERHARRFAARLDGIGFDPEFTEAVLSWRDRALTVVSMTPAELYLQTPGPQAGAQIGGGR